MEKGIVLMDMPINCFECKFKKRPFGMSFPEGMICEITEESIFQYKPHNINGTKPDWCPIKEARSSAYSRLFESKEIRTKTIKMVGEIVGLVGTMDCKRALEKSNWDITRAIEYLMNQSWIQGAI